jgi:hypothetical protein
LFVFVCRYWIDEAPFAPSDPHARYAMAPNTEHSYLFGLGELVPNVAAWAASVFAGTVATNPGFTWEVRSPAGQFSMLCMFWVSVLQREAEARATERTSCATE